MTHTVTPAPRAPIVRSRRTACWSALRRAAERYCGRSRLWSWLWDREFGSLMADRARAERKTVAQ